LAGEDEARGVAGISELQITARLRDYIALGLKGIELSWVPVRAWPETPEATEARRYGWPTRNYDLRFPPAAFGGASSDRRMVRQAD